MSSFTRRMEEARRLAKLRRHKGLHTGSSAKGWNWKRPELDRAIFADRAILAMDRWRVDAREALNDYRVACLNGPGSDVYECEIPF